MRRTNVLYNVGNCREKSSKEHMPSLVVGMDVLPGVPETSRLISLGYFSCHARWVSYVWCKAGVMTSRETRFPNAAYAAGRFLISRYV